MDNDKLSLKLTEIQLSIREMQTQNAIILARLEDHEARLRIIEQRKGFWTVLATLLGLIAAYFMAKFKH
jgi:hypothetical protein